MKGQSTAGNPAWLSAQQGEGIENAQKRRLKETLVWAKSDIWHEVGDFRQSRKESVHYLKQAKPGGANNQPSPHPPPGWTTATVTSARGKPLIWVQGRGARH